MVTTFGSYATAPTQIVRLIVALSLCVEFSFLTRRFVLVLEPGHEE